MTQPKAISLLALVLLGAGVHQARAATPDVCTLLKAEDIASATGIKVGTVKSRPPTRAEASACEYRHADTAQYGTMIVAAAGVFKPEKVASEEQVWTTMLTTRPVPGIGDAARYMEASSSLFVRKGAKAVYIQVLDNKGGSAARLGVLKTIANQLLGKL